MDSLAESQIARSHGRDKNEPFIQFELSLTNSKCSMTRQVEWFEFSP